LPTQAKREQVEAIRDWIERCSITIATDYTGLDVAEMTSLRRALRESGVEYRVVKNTLAHLAADGSGKPEVKGIVEGPTALAFGYDDPLVPAKVLVGFINANRSQLKVRGGVMGESVLTAEQISDLAALPPKEELLARLLGQLNGPIAALAYVLNAPVAGLARVLHRRVEMEQGTDATTEEDSPTE
jgi:large subunit ribosomal protein L10